MIYLQATPFQSKVGIPMTEVLDLLPLLRQCGTITCWYNEKLPSDKLVEHVTIKKRCWPLMIDPSLVKWTIKINSEMSDDDVAMV